MRTAGAVTSFRPVALLLAICHAQSFGAEATVDDPDISLAGIWTTIADASEGSMMVNLSGLRYAPITLADGRYGMVFGGFAYNPNPNPVSHPVNAFAVTRGPDGRMQAATTSLLGDPVTNGTADVVVGDLNGDGVDDILLVAHNEAPGTPKRSTAWLSSGDGRLAKVGIDDAAVVHGATLTTFNGRPTVFGASLWPGTGDPNPYYQYQGGTIVRTSILGPNQQGKPNSTFNAEDLAFGDFAGNGTQYVVTPNNVFGPSTVTAPVTTISIWKLSDLLANTGRPALVLDPYFKGKEQYKDTKSLWGAGITDLPRVWTDDFNHDGKLDFMNIASLWPSQFWTLQMFQNTTSGGALSFQDRGGEFWSGVPLEVSYIDYSMQVMDIDGSGIDSYLFAGHSANFDSARQMNYVMLNDGTGQLHAYYHDQFVALGQKVWQFLQREYDIRHFVGSATWPVFIGFPDGNGKLDFLAVQRTVDAKAQPQVFQEYLINMNVNADPAVDFRKNITISDRNGSQKLRTWAGDDLFYDTNASSQPTTIDGGAGNDTVVYSGAYGQYDVQLHADGSIDVQGNGVQDKLVNIQRLEFAGTVIDVAQERQQVLSAVASTTATIPLSRDSVTKLDTPSNLVTFKMGASSDRGVTTQTTFSAGDTVTIAGSVAPQAGDVGKAADIFIVVRSNLGSGDNWTYRTATGAFAPWVGAAIPNLQPAASVSSLKTSEAFEVYSGKLAAGLHRIYIGYRLKGSTVLHYTGQALVLNVEN